MQEFKSLIQRNIRECFHPMCLAPSTDCHHIFGGANRDLSTQYHLMIGLCRHHHLDTQDGIHFNKAFRHMVQDEAQTAFEKAYTNLDFVSIFGRNYKGENNE